MGYTEIRLPKTFKLLVTGWKDRKVNLKYKEEVRSCSRNAGHHTETKEKTWRKIRYLAWALKDEEKVKTQDKDIPDKAQARIFESHVYPAIQQNRKNFNQRNIRK